MNTGHGHPADVAEFPPFARPADPGQLAYQDRVAAAAKESAATLAGMVDAIAAAHPDNTHAATVLAVRASERALADACHNFGTHHLGAVLSAALATTAAAVLHARELERRVAELEADRG